MLVKKRKIHWQKIKKRRTKQIYDFFAKRDQNLVKKQTRIFGCLFF